MNEIKKPAIRFKGFSDEWKQSRVGELIEDYTEKTVVQNQYPVLTSSQQQGIVRQEEYFADRQVTTNDNIGYFVLPFGYFTYRSRSDTDIFVFNRNDLIEKGIISYYYPVFAPKNCNSDFLLRRLNNGIKKQLSMAAEGTGQKVLAHSKFKDMIVDVPDEEEQLKIGTIFKHVDNLIAQHQLKLEKLQSLKSTMLEKMFPKDGANAPELRFKEFTGSWKRVKIGDISEIITGGTPNTERQEYWEPKEIPWLSSGEIHKKRITFTNDKISEFGFENSGARWVKANSLLIALAGQGKTRGTVAITKIPITTNQSIAAIYFNSTIVPDFALANLEGRYNEIRTMSYGDGARGGLNKQLVSEIVIPYPSISEQKKIATLFEDLDCLITHHQQQLAKLQSLKKALLEKMFV